MGRTAVKIVASQMTVVEGPYGPYARSKRNIVKNPRALQRQSCIRSAMEGKKFGNVGEVHRAFAEASRSCNRGGAPVSGRNMLRGRRY